MMSASANSRAPFLSVIIPLHNEERRLPSCLAQLRAYFNEQAYEVEFLLVENGSADQTLTLARGFAKEDERIRVLSVLGRGKGWAVREGMLAARGEWRFACDVDLSMPIGEIDKFLLQRESYDLIIGTREGRGAKRIGEPQYRHWMGRVSNWIIKILAIRQFEDTQCGFKVFSAAAAAELFATQRIRGIGFDVEVLFLAARRGFRIFEVPITWYFDPDSRMRLFGDSTNLLLEIARIRLNDWRGYYSRADDG